jgi:hypothetical protein
MKAASLSDIKKELTALPKPELLELCIRLAKYKKENKELLSYLLFESGDETAFKEEIKAEMDLLFGQINKSNLYLAKKSLRKILRIVQKQVKFSGLKQTEAELLIYYLQHFKDSGISFKRNKVLLNLYERILKNIEKATSTLHEDLQSDLAEEIEQVKRY